MNTESTNYSIVHSTDPKIASETGSAPHTGYMLNEATTIATTTTAASTHTDSIRQHRLNQSYKVIGDNSSSSTMSVPTPPPSGPISSMQAMPIHGSYRRAQTNYPQAPTAQQVEAQRRPSQPVALSHIPSFWRSPAAAPLPAGHNHNHNRNHGHGSSSTAHNQAQRQPYSTSPNTQNGCTGNIPSQSKTSALTSRELPEQVHYSNLPKSLISSSSSSPHHIHTGPRIAAITRGRAPLPRGLRPPVAGDTSSKIESATTGYHAPGMRQRSLSTDATTSSMPYLRPIDGSRGRFNISDSSLVREDDERQVISPSDNHQYRYPSTIERSALAPIGAAVATSTYDSSMLDEEWPLGSFGHEPLATNPNKSSIGRKQQPSSSSSPSVPRITTVNNESSPSTVSPVSIAINNAFTQWNHASRNSTPSPSASPSSSVVNSPVDPRVSPARILSAYPTVVGSTGTMRPPNHNVPPPPLRQSGPMATFGRIMSRSKQQQQQQQQQVVPVVTEKVETNKSTNSPANYSEFNQNSPYSATPIGGFMKIEKPNTSPSNKLKVNTQMTPSQQGDQPRRHSVS
jgi:hypothetical protein